MIFADGEPTAAKAGSSMSDPKDKDPKEPQRTQPTVATGSEKRTGRISQDARGNSVWEWQLETGVYSRDISTQKLKKLDLDDLSIAETAVNKQPSGLEEEAAKPKLPGGGFNPYDNTKAGSAGGSNPYDNARATSKKLESAKTAPPAPRKPPDLKKLEEWMKMKQRLQDQKDKGEDDE